MSQEIEELKQHMSALQEEVRKGFNDFREWQSAMDVGMKGNAEMDIWGHSQKIKHNADGIKKNAEELKSTSDAIDKVRSRVNQIYWAAIGAAGVGGAAGSIIFQLMQMVFGNG